jgi:hypothetical protein
MLVRLLPDLLALLDIVRRVYGVVDANDHDQGPAEGYENSVCIQGASAVSLTSSKGIEGSHGEEIPKVKLGNLASQKSRGGYIYLGGSPRSPDLQTNGNIEHKSWMQQ